ncbi:hypothetical protein Taro_025067 [Colocasia esculenta]|uniref:Uncharacterized protein n=1 Tax=Colocasia esculenta TaxID=4460 RepID=A0A843VD53_COLES|nr:hypothetical protein [Colocasia esculenta]
MFLVQCYSSLFARCSALEGLSTRQVVSIAWDPQPRASVKGSSQVRLQSSSLRGRLRRRARSSRRI